MDLDENKIFTISGEEFIYFITLAHIPPPCNLMVTPIVSFNKTLISIYKFATLGPPYLAEFKKNMTVL